MVTAARAKDQVMDRTLRVEEHELKLAVAQFLRSRGVHATSDTVSFPRTEGEQSRGEMVAEVTLRVADAAG
jgi:hypothetical protein